MIKSFRCEHSKALFDRRPDRRFGADLHKIALRKLLQLDAATKLETLAIPPANRLEALKGDRKGFHAIRINQKWRICFRWRDGDAWDVEIVDYH